jgi:transcriptional regulator with XRE-family HTH domain
MLISNDFFSRLENLMRERGLSMAEVARMIHTQPSTLTRWRQGSLPHRNSLIALAAALHVDLEWLARGGPRVARGDTPAAFEHEAGGRLNDLGYSLSEQKGQGDLAGVVLGKMSVDELLTLAERLGGHQEALAFVLDAVRGRAAGTTTNYLKTKTV